MGAPLRVLINGLSIGEGGGLTVGRELLRSLAAVRPDWRFTMAVIAAHPTHERLRGESFPANCSLLFAPPIAARRIARSRYERSALVAWVRDNGAACVLQLNGMVIPALAERTLSHCQDPWSYIPDVWDGWRDRLLSIAKRRENARALREAGCVGFTSAYLRQLICGRLGVSPACAEVFSNGLPQDWIDAARRSLPPWEGRPMEIVSVGNVAPHKRQSLVIRSLPALLRDPRLATLVYRIIGNGTPAYHAELTALADRLGVGQHVVFEGRVSDARVREAYASARCAVLMSVCESFGLPVLEAMCFGAPVVVSDCCALPEVGGDAAAVSPRDDPDALAEHIRAILLDPNRAEDLRRRGAARVQHFSWPATAAKMAAHMERIADAAGKNEVVGHAAPPASLRSTATG
jgi:glycosyltransferase involved in cell wall biosynthesis